MSSCTEAISDLTELTSEFTSLTSVDMYVNLSNIAINLAFASNAFYSAGVCASTCISTGSSSITLANVFLGIVTEA